MGGEGKGWWLVFCKVERRRGGDCREYVADERMNEWGKL